MNLIGGYRATPGALLTLVLLLAVTIWMWHSATEESTRIARERFEFKVSENLFAIQQRLTAYEQVLRGGVGLFDASNEVTREEWRTYVRSLQIDKTYPGIRGIGFSVRVRPAQLAAHIRTIRTQGFPEYTIRPAGERAEYTSIIYLEPFDWRNQRAFGYDMFSEPVRQEAMARACDGGLPSVSGKVKLVQETNKGVQHGFLMFIPVFQKGVALQSAEERRAALLGYVYAPFRMNDLMQGILGPEKLPHVQLEIFDGTAVSAESRMYDSSEDAPDAQRTASAFTTQEAFEFNGRQWALRFRSLPAFDATIDAQKPRLILFGGVLVSVLFAAVVWFLSLNRYRARALARANRGLEAEIEERTKLEAQLEHAKTAAETASQAKSHFLANVSHELRTPLTLILAPLEQLIATSTPPSGWRVQLERVQRNGLLLLNRVNDILDFSKAEAGKFDVRWETVNLAELIPTLAADAAAVAGGKRCSLSWRVDPALDAVYLDRRHFEKILLNFVSNALKFTPAGGWIRLEAALLDDQWFEFAVADSGIGIPPDKQPLLFKRFEQVDSSATRQHGGTGIGLALVKELAELMGGSAGVESELGRGTRFFVRLPRGADRLPPLTVAGNAAAAQARTEADAMLRRARFQESSDAAPSTAGTDGAAREPSATAPQVLVVDDNPDMRSYVADLLRDECEVLTAADGLQAWALLERHHVDVVVSDVMMPELDGLSLTARIKANPSLSHLPVILVTARGGSEASASGLQSGADDYVAKPFSPEELRARVRAALRMGRVQLELREKSREAGMAMLAAGLLHNLGNVLTGVTVSSSVIQDTLHRSKATKLGKVVALLRRHANDLPGFFARDSRAQTLPAYLEQLAEHLEAERNGLLTEIEGLRHCAEHAAGVISSHRNVAPSGAELAELLLASSLMETALKLGAASSEMHGISIEREYAYTGSVAADRHKVLQILMNLLSNARHALRDGTQTSKRVRMRTTASESRVYMEVSDNGVGIDPQHLSTLFNQGFTTKGDGHGYGLHLSANWARELGGRLTCHSDGPGRGATFILELPAPALHAQSVTGEPVVQAAVCGR